MNDTLNEQPPVVEQPAADAEAAQYLQEFHKGANWFYFIAGLSVINSLVMLFGAGWVFIFGLGITQVVDGIAAEAVKSMEGGAAVWIVHAIGLGFSVVIAAVCALIGWLSNKGYGAVYLIGMILYLLDALLFVLLLFLGEPDFLGLVFHIIALFLMARGYISLRKLRALEASAQLQQPI